MSDFTVVYFKGLVHGFSVPRILAEFSIFGIPFSIKFYGAIIAFGFLLAVLFGGRGAYKWKMSLDKMIDVLIYGTILAIIGARLYYVVSQWSYYKGHLSEIYRVWEGGLSIYGGLIGGLIAAFIVCKVRKLNFYNLLDLCAMSFLIGQGIGRWGNFTNQEIFGPNTNLPWGMWSEKTAAFINLNQAEFIKHGISMKAGTMAEKAFVHPTFLYESIWCLLGFAVLYIICRKFRKFSGQVFLCYGVWYGAGRAVIESFRLDGTIIGNIGLTLNQVRSITVAVVCAVLLVILLIKYTKHPKPIDGVDYFSDKEFVKIKKKNAKGKAEEAVENNIENEDEIEMPEVVQNGGSRNDK